MDQAFQQTPSLAEMIIERAQRVSLHVYQPRLCDSKKEAKCDPTRKRLTGAWSALLGLKAQG